MFVSFAVLVIAFGMMLGLANGFIAIIGGFRPVFRVPNLAIGSQTESVRVPDPCCIHLPLLGIVVYVEVGVNYGLDPVTVCVVLVSLLLCLCVVLVSLVEVLPVAVVVVVALSVFCNINLWQ